MRNHPLHRLKKYAKQLKRSIGKKKTGSTSIKKKSRGAKISVNVSRLEALTSIHTFPFFYPTIVLIIGAILAYIVFGPTFTVQHINILKKDNITNIDIAYKSIEDLRGKSIFSIQKSKVLQKLNSYQENIKDTTIDIILPNTLKITLESYKGVFNTTVNNKTYILSGNGTFIPKRPSKELPELQIKFKNNKNLFLDYRQVFERKYISNILKILENLKTNVIGLQISSILYYEREREVHITINNGTLLIFDLHTDIKPQIEKIAVFNKEHRDLSDAGIIYIDLRIHNKVFYCKTEDGAACHAKLKSIYK